jgi:branched-chain amino acid transport system ATP-binding protein
MTALLELTDIYKRFGGLAAVSNLSCEVDEGEIVGLLGPNGSGKTTVLNMISGALTPTSGTITLRGRRTSGLAPNRIAHMGVARTFQLVRILPSLSVLENVMAAAAFGRHRHWGEEARQVALEHLEAVGMAGSAGRDAGDLTYIDQKRVELARALAAEPSLLLLDEWLSGLNPTELRDGIGLISSLRTKGTTILLVEHIMDAVRALCERCIVMNAGEIIADGPTGDVLKEAAVIRAYLGGGDA